MYRKLMCFLIAIMGAGCAIHTPSPAAPMNWFTVTTEPAGADIYYDGRYIGKSPCGAEETYDLQTHVYEIRAKKEGYKEGIIRIPNLPPYPAIKDMFIRLEKLPFPVQ